MHSTYKHVDSHTLHKAHFPTPLLERLRSMGCYPFTYIKSDRNGATLLTYLRMHTRSQGDISAI